MSGTRRESNPNSLIGLGACFMGAGLAIGLPGVSGGAGVGLTSLGLILLITGAVRKWEARSKAARDKDDDRPPA